MMSSWQSARGRDLTLGYGPAPAPCPAITLTPWMTKWCPRWWSTRKTRLRSVRASLASIRWVRARINADRQLSYSWLSLLCPQGDPVMVLPWLFLGNAYHASQHSRLQELGVTALLNVASSSPYLRSPCGSPRPFTYKHLSIDDTSTSDISVWFPEAIEFIGGYSAPSVPPPMKNSIFHCPTPPNPLG